MNYSRTISFLISVPLLALLIELTAPVLDEKYKITNYIRLILNMDDGSDQKVSKNIESMKFKMFKVKSSSGIPFMIPKHCKLKYLETSPKYDFDNTVKDSDYTLSNKLKLNDVIESTENAGYGTTDVINCEGTDAIWYIFIGNHPDSFSLDESNIMSECVNFGEMINKLHNGKTQLHACKLHDITVGTNNLYTEFTVNDENIYGEYTRFAYNFLYQKFYFSVIGQCHLKSRKDCNKVSEITIEIAKSFAR